jgi:hypothetical protein
MDRVVRRLQPKAQSVGLEVRGPYADRTYSLWSDSIFLGQGDAQQIEAEITKSAGVTRLADARRRKGRRGD